MVHVEGFWSCLNYVLSFLTLSPFAEPGHRWQSPLLGDSGGSHHDRPYRGPKFKPPGGRLEGPGADFVCEYPNMPGYEPCVLTNRSCWLRNPKTGDVFDIDTDYENRTPNGTVREYWLNLTDTSVNADGQYFTDGKLFNSTYPGPWIQACWGDNVTIHVRNELKYNGTSVHWHGIRQLNTMHMDGVNGITQCPIAPKDNFTYTWRVQQYGSSWYHSHYSVQYADGAAGPITLHGPSSANYTEAKTPLIMTDWGHNSAFDALWNDLANQTILLNGKGNVTAYNNSIKPTADIPTPYTITFDPPTKDGPNRYLMRVINTSFRSHFVFSIDNHRLQIVGADFVPITPYFNESVLVGIGQRYHVIVTAKPETNSTGHGNPLPSDGNYWIRTFKADCFGFENIVTSPRRSHASPGYEKTGILRYNASSKALPSTQRWNFSLNCSDETYSSLKPIVPWSVGNASNHGENFTVQTTPKNVKGDTVYPLAVFSIGGAEWTPLRIDYGNPTFLNLNFSGKWNPLWVVIPENYTAKDWVYMAIIGKNLPQYSTSGAHPIHLHGHDFAILQQVGNTTWPNGYKPNLKNPPRRDVVLLPTDGYVVIAFKTDNPGAWLVHCHIADHAALGLAMQILERQSAATDIWPNLNVSHALQRAQNTCNQWNKWWGDCNNWWPGGGKSCLIGNNGFSPDSGI